MLKQDATFLQSYHAIRYFNTFVIFYFRFFFPALTFLFLVAHSDGPLFEEGWQKAVRLKTMQWLNADQNGKFHFILAAIWLLLFCACLCQLLTSYCSGTTLPPADSTNHPNRKLSRAEGKQHRVNSMEETFSISLPTSY